MKDEELRIGNIVSVIYEGGGTDKTKNPKCMRISGITSETTYFSDCDNGEIDEDELEYSQILPLELNDDVMKCTNLVFTDSYVYEIPDIHIMTFEVWDKAVRCHIMGQFIIEVRYLHKLQNLYFVLMGEELEIDLPKLNQLIK